MNYEKKYKDALEKAKSMIDDLRKGEDILAVSDLESMFPELAESEDERIRKEIIDFLWKEKIFLQEVHLSVENSPKYRFVMDAIAWLEKQGEQKPVDKVEPKFKVGDFIVNDYCMGKVIELTNDAYLLDTEQGIPFSYEHNAHLWTIADAKDGDILASDNSIFIFKEEYIAEKPTAYCGLMNGLFIKGNGACWTNEKCYPATKEQRDVLMKAMKDAGYTFDFEKKELKKIEDKEYNGEDYGIDGLWHAHSILEKTLGKVDGYQTDDGILEHKCAISAVKKLYEQNTTEWSKEDEHEFQIIQKIICDSDTSSTLANRLSNWLKSLKQIIGG